MSEIDKINAVRFQKVNLKREEVKKQASVEENGVEFLDFANAKAASLGRSQVSTPDKLENDVKFMMKHPETVMQSNMFFDNAYEMLKNQNEERAYERSAQMMQAFRDEFMLCK